MEVGFVLFLLWNVVLVVARQCAYPSSNYLPSTTTRWSIDISNWLHLRVQSHGSIFRWHRLHNWKLFFAIVFVIWLLWHLVENTKQMSKVYCRLDIRELLELSFSSRSAILTFDVATEHMTISMILPLCSDLNVSLDGDGYVHRIPQMPLWQYSNDQSFYFWTSTYSYWSFRGVKLSSNDQCYLIRPVNVQALWFVWHDLCVFAFSSRVGPFIRVCTESLVKHVIVIAWPAANSPIDG